MRLEGVERVGEAASVEDWTCEIHPGPGFPVDAGRIDTHFQRCGVGARLRGMEATVAGTLEFAGGEVLLRPAAGGLPIALVALTRKVQWDVRRNRQAAPSNDERQAMSRLLRRARGRPGTWRITGPLVVSSGRQYLSLEVRKFVPAPEDRGAVTESERRMRK
jgi:hypothetical protein